MPTQTCTHRLLFPGPSKVENLYLNFPKPQTPNPDCHGIVPNTTYQACLHKHAHTSFSWAFAEASCPYCGIRATWRTCAPPLTGRPSSVGVLLRGRSLCMEGFEASHGIVPTTTFHQPCLHEHAHTASCSRAQAKWRTCT